jgi:probable F420-dependent oxidoreductase
MAATSRWKGSFMRDFRFGFTLASPKSQAEVVDVCKRAEEFGYDIAVGVDHLGPNRTGPFLAAMAAAAHCKRMKVGTYVLDIGFWHGALVARDVASLMRMTDNRFELGLGTGVVKAQFDRYSFRWPSFPERVRMVSETVDTMHELLPEEDGVPLPPILIGGGGDLMMRLAAAKADIVSFAGRMHVHGQPAGTLRIVTRAEIEDRVKFFEAAAGERMDQIERNLFVLEVVVTDDRRAAAQEVADAYAPHSDVDDLLESPNVMFGTEDEIVQQILDLRENYGFTYFTVQRPHMEPLGPILEKVRSRA